jgi:transcriptional regulator
MYDLPYYKDHDNDTVVNFIKQHPFAFIAGSTKDGKPVATQIPVFIDERDGKIFLSGHIMRKTDHHKAFEENSNVLCVFTGDHSYVSATWYSNPRQASTWNYMSVHARGVITFMDEDQLVEVLKRTTLHFENNNASSSTVFDNLDADYRERLMKAIVAFEVEVTSLDHVFKLSQDRDKESYHNIISKLEETDAAGKSIAFEMKNRADKLYT